jgi:exonuclease III
MRIEDNQKLVELEGLGNSEIFANIKIGIHNINGLKGNYYKAQELVDLAQEMDFNIVGLVETNIKESEGNFLKIDKKDYNTFWANAEKGKHKGSGVGIWIDNAWHKHLTGIKRPNAYSIRATFSFKKAILTVWIIYIPPNDKEKTSEIQRMIVKDIIQKQRNEHFIIGGDFNRMLNLETDRVGKFSISKLRKLALITWLGKMSFTETYRFCNPKGGKYTWKNSETQTRIDQIWISKDLALCLQNSDIEDMEFRTDSDHNLIWAQISLNSIFSFTNRRNQEGKIKRRKIFLYNEATKENWEDYTAELEKLIQAPDRVRGLTKKNKEVEEEEEPVWVINEK